jgi:hypothetical protein
MRWKATSGLEPAAAAPVDFAEVGASSQMVELVRGHHTVCGVG